MYSISSFALDWTLPVTKQVFRLIHVLYITDIGQLFLLLKPYKKLVLHHLKQMALETCSVQLCQSLLWRHQYLLNLEPTQPWQALDKASKGW